MILEGGVEVKKAACWFCYQNCGMLVYVKNGEIIKVEGDPDHPIIKAGCAQDRILGGNSFTIHRG